MIFTSIWKQWPNAIDTGGTLPNASRKGYRRAKNVHQLFSKAVQFSKVVFSSAGA